MTRFLAIERVLLIYRYLMEQSGGIAGLRDRSLLEAAIAQPQMTFAGAELYPSLTDKASALGFSLIQNHPFIDGNKRIGIAPTPAQCQWLLRHHLTLADIPSMHAST